MKVLVFVINFIILFVLMQWLGLLCLQGLIKTFFGNDKTEPDSKRAANGDNIPFLPNFLLKSLSKEDETNLLKWRKLVNQGRKMRVSDMFSGESNQDKLPKNNEDKKVKPL